MWLEPAVARRTSSSSRSRVVGERVGERRALRVAGHERLARRRAVAAQGEARGQGHEDEDAREQHDAGATGTGAAAHRHSPWQTLRASPAL